MSSASISHWMASVISSSPRADGFMARDASRMRLENRYTPTSARSDLGSRRLLDQLGHVPTGIELRDAEALGVAHLGEQDLRTGTGRLELADELADAARDQVVAQVHDEVVGTQVVGRPSAPRGRGPAARAGAHR